MDSFQGAFNSHLYPCYTRTGISVLATDFNRPDVTIQWPDIAYKGSEWKTMHFLIHIGHVDDAKRTPYAKKVLEKLHVDQVSRLQTNKLVQIYTNTDCCLVAVCTWIL
jgi:hypothetical protein